MTLNDVTTASLPIELTAHRNSVTRRILARPAVFGSLIPAVTLLNAVVGMILPRLMAPAAFGEYTLVATLFNYGLIFDLGMSQVLDRRVPGLLGLGEAAQADAICNQILWVRLQIGVGAFLLAALALVVLRRFDILPFQFTAGLLAVLAGLADMVALGPACIHRARSARQNYAIEIATLLCGLIFARLTGLYFFGVVGCFGAMALWYLGFAFAFHTPMPLKFAALPDFARSRRFIIEGIPLFATSFVWAFYVTGNRWIASSLMPPDEFGQFAFSANIFSLLVGAAGGFSAFYYPRIVALLSASPRSAVSSRLARDMVRLTAGVGAVTAFGIVFSGLLIAMIYPQYSQSVATARIILVAIPPMVLASWLMPLSLSAGRRPWVDGYVIYPAATLLLVVSIVLLHGWLGAAGAAWASTVSAIALIALQLSELARSHIFRGGAAVFVFAFTLAICGLLSLLLLVFKHT